MGFAQVEVTNPEGETISIILTDARGGAWAPGSEHLYAKAIQINPNGGRGSTPIDLSGYAWSTTTSKTYDTWYRNDSPNPIYVSVVSQGLAHEDGSTQLLYTPIGTGTPSGIPLSEVGGINVEGQVNTQKSTAFGWIPPNHYYKVVRVGVSINPDNWRITYWNEYRDDTAHIAPMRYVMFDQPITYCEPGPGPTLTSANGFTGEVAECNNVLSSCGVPREARMVHAAVYHGSANQSRVLKAGIRHTTGSQTVTRFIREVAAAQDDGGGGDRNIANFILPLPAYSNINDTDSKLIFFLYNQSDTPVTASNGYSFFWCKIWGYWI
jgi:hypothetical protein